MAARPAAVRFRFRGRGRLCYTHAMPLLLSVRRAVLVAFLVAAAGGASRQAASATFLRDDAGILTREQRESLETALREIEEQTTAEVAVVTIADLGGRSIEGYALDLFNRLGIGKKDRDNGVLILFSVRERKVRIEVGYGLESVLTDGRCGAIIRDSIAPAFREKDYFGGITAAVDAIRAYVESGEPEGREGKTGGKGNRPPVIFFLFWYGFCLLFAFGMLGIIGLGIQFLLILGTNIAGLVLFRMHSALAELLLVLSLLLPFAFLFPLGIAGSIVHGILRRSLRRKHGRQWKKYWPSWVGSSSGPSSSSGGGFSGGGGFGGGSSGGGGASGGW